eukprot:TRINITY_DN3049_c0_g1_i1.p1 TRINITY_DN3049_c0_g1~~TRINITY_DN3049_c0_g1_i1.p1  ORF type:complete len:284 (-),score=130.38 TRINITY_DN3049_c0_g1_i1:69-794(-)
MNGNSSEGNEVKGWDEDGWNEDEFPRSALTEKMLHQILHSPFQRVTRPKKKNDNQVKERAEVEAPDVQSNGSSKKKKQSKSKEKSEEKKEKIKEENFEEEAEEKIEDEEEEVISGTSSPIEPKEDAKRKRRTNRACVTCKKDHASCDNNRPCKRCLDRGIADSCEDATVKVYPSKRSENTKNNTNNDINHHHNNNTNNNAHAQTTNQSKIALSNRRKQRTSENDGEGSSESAPKKTKNENN